MSTSDAAERYVAGRMTEEEERAFEIAMLQHPELTAEVDTRQRIKAGLEHLNQRGDLDALIAQPPRRGFLPIAVAAGLLLVLFGATAYWRLGGLSDSSNHFAVALSATAIPGVSLSASYLLASTRSAAAEPTIDTKSGAGPVRLQIIPESRGVFSFAAALTLMTTGHENPAAPPVQVTQGDSPFLEVFLNPSKLSSGRYRLRLTPQTGQAPEDYFLTINVTP